ncbi:MAG: hypothetical protein WC796_03485 [Candidatus Pacearchaeota archaeon]|jgi:hypothetical protein
MKKIQKYNPLIRVFIVVVLLGSVFFFGSINKNSVTGLDIISINANSLSNQKLEGNIKLSLKPGELLPKESLLIIKDQDDTYKFPISNLINDTPIEGNFYIESSSLSPNGYGYGYGYGFTVKIEGYGYGYGISPENQDQKEYEININLSSLNLNISSKEITASLEYNGTEIASINTTLNTVDETNPNIDSNETLANTTVNNTNSTDQYTLTTEELSIIKENTGQEQVKITKSQEFHGRLIIRFEIGDYWLENSYSYPNQNNEDLKKQIEIDRKIWLKNLAKEFLNNNETANTSNTPKNVEEFIGNYSI